MSTQELERTAAEVPARRRGPVPLPGGARWRAVLEQRWQDRLQEVTQLSLEFHEAGAAVQDARGPQLSLRQLTRRAVIARRGLADLDDALDRLAAGHYGRCERCSSQIPHELLARLPEERYCLSCA
jgi:RNA polymerase-binding transcription factor DksA